MKQLQIKFDETKELYHNVKINKEKKEIEKKAAEQKVEELLRQVELAQNELDRARAEAPSPTQHTRQSWANEANEIEKEEIEQVKQLLKDIEIPETDKIIKISKYTRENFNNNQKETYKYFLIMIEQEKEIILLKTDQNIQNIEETILILKIQKINQIQKSNQVDITSNVNINLNNSKIVEMNISLIFMNLENIATFKQFLGK